MKPALIQNALTGSVATQNLTDSSVSSDLIFAQHTMATPALGENDTNKARARMSIGATDLTNQAAIAFTSENGTTGGVSNNYITNAQCLVEVSNTGSTTVIEASHSSALSNGEQISVTKNSGASTRLVNTLLISGNDMEIKVTTFTLTSGQTSISHTHGCGGTPNAFEWAVVRNVASLPAGRTTEFLKGFWDGTSSVGVGFQHTTGSNPSAVAARMTADAGHMITGDADVFNMTISGVGASTVTIGRSATNSVPVYGYLISYRYTGTGSFAAKVVQGSLPTTTGVFTPFSGMSVQPQLAHFVATRLTSTSLATDDSAGALCFGTLVNNAGTAQQGVIATTDKDNVATGVTASQTSNAKCLRVLDNTGALAFDAGYSSFNPDGLSLNCTTQASGLGYQYIGLAMGASASSIAPVAQSLNRTRRAA